MNSITQMYQMSITRVIMQINKFQITRSSETVMVCNTCNSNQTQQYTCTCMCTCRTLVYQTSNPQTQKLEGNGNLVPALGQA